MKPAHIMAKEECDTSDIIDIKLGAYSTLPTQSAQYSIESEG